MERSRRSPAPGEGKGMTRVHSPGRFFLVLWPLSGQRGTQAPKRGRTPAQDEPLPGMRFLGCLRKLLSPPPPRTSEAWVAHLLLSQGADLTGGAAGGSPLGPMGLPGPGGCSGGIPCWTRWVTPGAGGSLPVFSAGGSLSWASEGVRGARMGPTLARAARGGAEHGRDPPLDEGQGLRWVCPLLWVFGPRHANRTFSPQAQRRPWARVDLAAQGGAGAPPPQLEGQARGWEATYWCVWGGPGPPGLRARDGSTAGWCAGSSYVPSRWGAGVPGGSAGQPPARPLPPSGSHWQLSC